MTNGTTAKILPQVYQNFNIVKFLPKSDWVTYNAEVLIQCHSCYRQYAVFAWHIRNHHRLLTCLCQIRHERVLKLYNEITPNDLISNTFEYKVWAALKFKAKRNKITMDENWQKNFMNFISELGGKPDYNYQMFCESKHYCKDNCFWKERDCFRLISN